MDANFKFSEQVAILAALHSSSQSAGVATTSWVPAANFHRMAAIVDIGSVGAAGTVAVAVLQAQDNSGTGSKAVASSISGNAIATAAPVAASGDVVLGFKLDDLDANNGYGYVALQVTVSGNAVQTAAVLMGTAPRIAPASQYNASSVTVD